VGANVLDRVVFPADVEHRHGCAVDVHDAMRAGRELARLRYADPASRTRSKSPMRRQALSGPAGPATKERTIAMTRVRA
jgi:hypothetical protein